MIGIGISLATRSRPGAVAVTVLSVATNADGDPSKCDWTFSDDVTVLGNEPNLLAQANEPADTVQQSATVVRVTYGSELSPGNSWNINNPLTNVVPVNANRYIPSPQNGLLT